MFTFIFCPFQTLLSPLLLICSSGLGLSHSDPDDPASSALSPGQLGPPYLDKGRICQEKMEVVQEVQFEKQIRCDIQMQEK